MSRGTADFLKRVAGALRDAAAYSNVLYEELGKSGKNGGPNYAPGDDQKHHEQQQARFLGLAEDAEAAAQDYPLSTIEVEKMTPKQLFDLLVQLDRIKVAGNRRLVGPEVGVAPKGSIEEDPLLREVLERGLNVVVIDHQAVMQALRRTGEGRELLMPGMAEIEARRREEGRHGGQTE